MLMNLILKIAALTFYFMGFIEFGFTQSLSSQKGPNVILILADDLGVGDLSSVNGGMSRTPVLDRLKKESVWFNQAYSGSAVCAPARAALLTGKYPHRTGVVSLSMSKEPELTSLKKSEVTIADMFKRKGYHTSLIGKWHLGIRPAYHPMKRGFQEFAGFKDVESYYNFKLDINGTYKEYKGPYLTDVLTEFALNYLDKHKDAPFFLHLAYKTPHRPLSAPDELVDDYRKRGFDEKTSKVYAMIEVMDKGIGEIVEKLDELRIRKNTLIIFTSDNGPDPLTGERFNDHLTGQKYSVNEGGIRVPLMFNWEGTLEPGVVEDLAHFTDMVPTLADICNLELSGKLLAAMDGGSLYHSLQGKKSTNLPSLRYWQWNRGLPDYTHNAAIRDGDWKLVRPLVTRGNVSAESGLKPMLFNLENDPSESKDVSMENAERYYTMRKLLDAWSEKMESERLKNTD